MGFLTSAFNLRNLTKLISQENNKVDSCMRKIRIAKRQYSVFERSITNQQRVATNAARNNYQTQMSGIQALAMQQAGLTTLQGADSAKLSAYNTAYSTLQAQLQMEMQTTISMAEQEAEALKEMQLEPLKEEQEDLEVEKQEAESNAKLYTEWKQAAKEDIQNSVKNLTPQYSSGAA